jgi:hypothetical protein
LLENAHAHFDEIGFDNWDGGTTTWALRLELPTSLFATVQARLPDIEKELGKKLDYLDRLNPNDPLAIVGVELDGLSATAVESQTEPTSDSPNATAVGAARIPFCTIQRRRRCISFRPHHWAVARVRQPRPLD